MKMNSIIEDIEGQWIGDLTGAHTGMGSEFSINRFSLFLKSHIRPELTH